MGFSGCRFFQPAQPDLIYTPHASCGIKDRQTPGGDLLRLPYLQSVTQSTAVIAWVTRTPGDPKLRVGAAKSLQSAASLASRGIVVHGKPATLHAAELRGLAPGTRYCYEIASGSEMLATSLSFKTAPATPGAPLSFFAFGDFGNGSQAQFELRDQMRAVSADIDLWISTGDNAYGAGRYDQFEDYVFQVYGDLFHRIPFFPSPGNHDYRSDDAAPYLTNFFLPENAWRSKDKERYYSFDWGPVHFVALDTEDPLLEISETAGDDMQDWLAADLAATKKPWKIVFFHKPPYTSHPKRAPNLKARELLVPVLEEHGVQIVLAGHNHFYERFYPLRNGRRTTMQEGGITYLTTGGGGAPVYRTGQNPLLAKGVKANHFLIGTVTDCSVLFRAVGLNGREIDRFTFNRCAAQKP